MTSVPRTARFRRTGGGDSAVREGVRALARFAAPARGRLALSVLLAIVATALEVARSWCSMTSRDLNALITAVFQGVQLFTGTIGDNIGFGRPVVAHRLATISSAER